MQLFDGWIRDMIATSLFVLLLGIVLGAGMGVGFCLAAAPAFDRAERLLLRVERMFSSEAP